MGSYDTAVLFDGVDDTMVASIPDLTGGGDTDGTVVFWMSPDSTDGYHVPLSITDPTGSFSGVTVLTSGQSLLVKAGNRSFSPPVAGVTLTAGESYMVAVVWDNVDGAGTYEVFFDGQSAKTGTWTALGEMSVVNVGGGSTNSPFKGIVDEVAIFDSTLTAAQILELYEEADHGKKYAEDIQALGPQYFWRLDERSGSVAADATGTVDGTYTNIAPENLGRPALLSDGALYVQLTPESGGGAASGAWSKTFELDQLMVVDVSFSYRVRLGDGIAGNEYADVLAKLDNELLGDDVGGSVVHLDATSGADTGWVTVEFSTSLFAGRHTLSIGALSSPATGAGDTVDLLIDDVFVTASSMAALSPGQRGLLVSNQAAFEARYGLGYDVLSEYSGNLDNGGETLALKDALGNLIFEFTYSDSGEPGWPNRADGRGSSLERIDTGGEIDYANPDSWRSSSELGGTPGGEGAGPVDNLIVNEVLTHTDGQLLDSIELYNTTGASVDVGGWYLSDANRNLFKYEIPAGTEIPANGYLVFNETHFNPNPAAPGPNDFALNGAHGDDVWLMKVDAAGVAFFVDHVEFGGAANGESFGRWPNASGSLYPMTEPTLDAATGYENAGPRIGPLVISEVHFNSSEPAGEDDLEFVEIYNPTDAAVELTG